MGLDRYWYILCESDELDQSAPLSRRLLGTSVVLFRDKDSRPAAFRDRCLHRCGRLSKGRVNQEGHLVCPYHGWSYNSDGEVCAIPAEVPGRAESRRLRMPSLALMERDGYIYCCLRPDESTPKPFAYDHLERPGWRYLRLINQIENTVLNCVENFIDVPHTVFTHHGVFREPELKTVSAQVRRENGHVHISYQGETSNLGSFSWFLNPKKAPVLHSDEYFVPNVTHVTYKIGRTGYAITSQSVPESEGTTKVYTTIAWHFGAFSGLAAPIVRRQAQKVIDQDIEVLKDQFEVMTEFGGGFVDTEADRIHQSVAELYEAAMQGEAVDLPPQYFEISFRI